MYPGTCLRSASDPCVQAQTDGFAQLQFKSLYTTGPMTGRAQYVFRPVTSLHNNSAMPLSDLEGYGSDSGSSDDSPDSDAMPDSCQQNSDPDATCSDSDVDRLASQKFDAMNSWTPETRLALANRHIKEPIVTIGISDGWTIYCRLGTGLNFCRLDFCAGVCSSESDGPHGLGTMWCKTILTKRLPELWQSLCRMLIFKSHRNIIPRRSRIFLTTSSPGKKNLELKPRTLELFAASWLY